MIEINLVPDIKQEMLRAQRMRNVAITISILVGVAAGTVVLILAGVLGGQVAVEKMTEGTINDQYKKLVATQDINDMIKDEGATPEEILKYLNTNIASGLMAKMRLSRYAKV